MARVMPASPAGITRRQWVQACAGASLAGAGFTVAPFAWAGAQREEALSHAVRTALSAAVALAAPPEPVLPTTQDQQAYSQWLTVCSQRLRPYQSHPTERQEFLQTLWYEARRAGLSLSLVLGLVQVESAFRKHAVSSAGARGYMQVMPFWTRLIGDGDASVLFHMQTNLRFGCVILRHYLDQERGDVFMGLGRYNGSRGQATYPEAVAAARRGWRQPVD